VTFLARAPALAVLAAWSLGLALLGKGAPPAVPPAAALLAASGLILLGGCPTCRGFSPLAALVVGLSLAGVLFFQLRFVDPELPGQVAGEARVLSERSWGARRLVVLEVEGLRLVARVPPRRTVVAGSRLDVEGTVAVLEGPREGEEFDFSRWARARGIVGELRPRKWLSLPDAGRWSLGRNELERRLLLRLPPLLRGHLLAAWLGERDPDLAEAHRRWGTAHLLAVSGFHVALVVAVLCVVPGLGRLRFPFVSALLWGYVFLAGAPASAVRAALMVQLYLLGRMMGRKGGGLNAVSLAGILLLLWSPWWFWDVGWRLSMTAALTLASLPCGEGPLPALLSGLPVWLTTAPVAAGVFGFVPLAGLFINLAALPLFAFLLPAASLAALPALAGLPGGETAARFAEDLFALWAWGADAMASLVPGTVGPSAALFAAGTFVFFLLILKRLAVGDGAALAVSSALTVFCSLLH